MAFCEHALTRVGTKNERLIKIDILLLMMEIVRYTNPKNKWKPERYFYQAVEIARCCLGEDFLITPHGIKIKEYFYKYINPAWSKMFNNK